MAFDAPLVRSMTVAGGDEEAGMHNADAAAKDEGEAEILPPMLPAQPTSVAAISSRDSRRPTRSSSWRFTRTRCTKDTWRLRPAW